MFRCPLKWIKLLQRDGIEQGLWSMGWLHESCVLLSRYWFIQWELSLETGSSVCHGTNLFIWCVRRIVLCCSCLCVCVACFLHSDEQNNAFLRKEHAKEPRGILPEKREAQCQMYPQTSVLAGETERTERTLLYPKQSAQGTRRHARRPTCKQCVTSTLLGGCWRIFFLSFFAVLKTFAHISVGIRKPDSEKKAIIPDSTLIKQLFRKHLQCLIHYTYISHLIESIRSRVNAIIPAV